MHAASSIRALASIATLAGAAAVQADGWATLTPIPVGRYNAAAVALNGRIYVFGGFTSLGASSDCYSYCEEDSTWLVLASMLAPRYNGIGLETEGTIYQIGGFSAPNTVTSTLYKFDPRAGTNGVWTSLLSHPIPTASGVGASIYGKLYLTTYNDGSGTPRNYLSEYDILNNTWTQKSNSMFPHGRAAGGDLMGNFIVAGGAGASGVATNVVEKFVPHTNTWSLLSPMPVALKNAAYAVRNDRLWVMGGIDAAGAESAGVYCYDLMTDHWSTRTPLPSARFNSFGSFVDDGVYTFGGQHGTSILNNVNGWGIPCYGNCDGSTAAPVLNVNDFVCFIAKFADGCK